MPANWSCSAKCPTTSRWSSAPRAACSADPFRLQFPFRPGCASHRPMRSLVRLSARLLALAALLGIASQPAAAQAILRDAETEALLQDLVDPLVAAAGMQKGAVDVVL